MTGTNGWTWRYHAADGGQTDPAPGDVGEAGFPSQADAEMWVGESWRELLDAGVESVSLLHGGETVYGPMSLRPLE